MTMEELSNVHGRAWEDVDVSFSDCSSLECTLTRLIALRACTS